ncbi:MAG: class I SAM-dependent methyltransferase [Nitrospira sp.]|nr:class I SAM-dependent methyltransferase [Nitrospira sp.]
MNKPPTTDCDYASKSAEYFTEARPEMLSFVPINCRRLLDVGCGTGTFGASLKRTRQIEVWGVEPFASAAAIAAGKLDRVITGPFEPESDLPAGAFDCIVFNDVLEHMAEPELALRYAKRLLSAGGTILASIPNVRHFPVLWQLGIRGSWEYRDCGILDRTHLRFFTKSSILKMFQDEGCAVRSISGINPYMGIPNASRRLWFAYRAANVLFMGKFTDLKFQQFAVVAEVSPV